MMQGSSELPGTRLSITNGRLLFQDCRITLVKTTSEIIGQESGSTYDWANGDIETARTNIKTVGFTCIERMFNSQLLSKLRSEAFLKKKDAVPVCGTSQCQYQYQAHLTGLGKAGISFLTGNRILKILDILLGMPLALEKDASCYTYYQPGDFLGPHLDHAEQCIVTVILYLDVVHSDVTSDKTGLVLHVIGGSPSDVNNPRVVLPTKAGSLIIGLGAANWHERPTLQNGEFLTAITACYSRLLSA